MEKRRIKNKVAYHTMVEEELYRKNPIEGPPMKICVIEEEGALIEKSIHEGGCHNIT